MENGNLKVNTFENLPVGITVYDAHGNPDQGYGALGLFNISIDRDSLTGEMTPLRSSTSTDTLEVVDITNFLMLAPCTDCAKLMSIEMDTEENIILKIGIRHPFDAGDPFKPISGRNRGDLHVFNVEGLVVSDGTGVTTFPGLNISAGNTGLINADGLSPYLDGVLDDIFPTDAGIHPYILHFDDYSAGNYDPSNPMGFESVTDPPPSGNLVMAMGCDYDVQDYVFDTDGDLEFIYAIGCTYAVSADTKLDRFTPEYRIPQHNKKAASEVWVEIVNNELAGEDETSFAELEIKVVDINHGVLVGSALNEMFADSSVGDVSVEIPGVTTSPVSLGSTPSGGSGHDPDDPLIFPGTIYNTGQAAEGTYSGLVKVTDLYPPGSNTSLLLGGKDGIKRVDPLENPLSGLFEINEFATYANFSVTVELGISEFPVCEITHNCIDGDPPQVNDGGHILLDASDSYDPDGTVESYEWDFDYDGITFDVDETGVEAGFECTSAGIIDIALRLTDNNLDQTICIIQIDCTGNPRDWETPVRVTNTDNYWMDQLQSPNGNALAMTKDCVVHLVYFDWYHGSYPQERNVRYTNYDGSSWSTPELIKHYDTSYVMSVAMVVDSEGYVHGVLCKPGPCELQHFENSTGSFVLEQLDSGCTGYDNITIAINNQDQIMVGVEADDYNSATLNKQIVYYNDGTGFGGEMVAVEHCDDRGGGSGIVPEPDLCATPDGHFHLVYNGLHHPPCPSSDWNREVYHAEFDGTSWTDYGPISSISSDCHQPRAFSDPDGNLHCVVGVYSQMYYARRDASTGVWSNFEYIVSGGTGNYQPDLEIDKWGMAHMVWYRREGTSYLCKHKSFHVDDSIAEKRAAPEDTIPSGLGGDNRFAHCHVDFNGDLHVVYEDRTLGWWVNTELFYVRYR